MYKKNKYSFYKEECVVYNTETADLHLLTLFNAELLKMINKEVDKSLIIDKVMRYHGIDEMDSVLSIEKIVSEFKSLNLVL